jgi:Tol biopolymer transport system component
VARPVAGTEDALVPFWSPDSQWVGFRALGRLKRVPVSGGTVQTICEAAVESLPSWGSDGTILFSDLSVKGREGIFVVPATGGEPKQVTRLDLTTNEREHFWPSFLPDGEQFFYLASRIASDHIGLDHTLYVGSLSGKPAVRVADIDSRVFYVPTGHVLYASAGTVMAQRFDTRTLQFHGDPIPIVDDVQYYKATGMVEMSASSNGLLAIQENFQFSELVWLDRAGRELGVLESGKEFGNLRISPSGHRIAVEVVEPSTSGPDLYMFDRDSGIPTRFTSGGYASSPVWSPDGETIHFRSGSPPDLFRKRADGRGGDERLGALGGIKTPLDVSGDGRLLVYSDAHRTTNQDLWLLPLGGGEPTAYLTTAAWETAARFSPDSKWLAFVSTESGSNEVHVAPVDDARAKHRVSAAGGIAPRWGKGGKELLYITADGNVVSVPLTLGRQLQRGTPTMMFKIGSLFEAAGLRGNAAYELTPDGQRLLVNRVLRDPAQAPLTLLTNWTALLPK